MGEPKVTREGTKAVIQPDESLVASTAPQLRTLMRELVQGGVKEMIMDFSETKMVDSTGIGLLISAHNSLSKAGGSLSVTHVSRDILDLFATMRMNRLFSVSASS